MAFRSPKLGNKGGSLPRPRSTDDAAGYGSTGLFANGFGREALGGGQGMKRAAARKARIGQVNYVEPGPPGFKTKGR